MKKALNKKKKLWKKYVNSKNLNDLNVFKVHRKLCKKEIANAKFAFESQLAGRVKDPKAFYSYSRSKLKTKESVGQLQIGMK